MGLGMTFKVVCTLLVSSLELLDCFLSWSPLVPSSTSDLQSDGCRKEVSAKLRPPQHSRRLPRESFAVTAPFSLAPLPVFCLPLLTLLICGPATRSLWNVHYDGISSNVTEPFAFSLALAPRSSRSSPPCSCCRESLPRGRLAHRACSQRVAFEGCPRNSNKRTFLAQKNS